MPTLQQNPFLLNIVHSNSAHSSSSFRVNFMNSGSILQNSSQNYRPSSPNRGIQHRRSSTKVTTKANRKLIARASEGDENASAGGRSFLSFEEAGLVEMSGLSTHERFLCRLTISSLNLLRVVAEQEGCEIEELNAGKICDWFLKDRLKREQNIGSAVLQWEDDDDDDDGLQF